MADFSYFESRSGKPECSPEQIFNFVSDIRNFERFLPPGTVKNWRASDNDCSFTVPKMGDVNLSIAQKEKYNLVAYKGTAMKNNEFEIILRINRTGNNMADVKVALNAELNPMMKMIASQPIKQFLEMVIERIENFRCWEQEVR